MRRGLAVAVLGLVVLAGCSDDKAPMLTGDGPAPTSVDVDTPELRELRAEAGLEECERGPGGGGLPAVTVACRSSTSRASSVAPWRAVGCG